MFDLQKITIGSWNLEYDKIATQNAYSNSIPINQGCSCNSCENYYQASKKFPAEINSLFGALGIDASKPAEVYDCGVFENGRVLYGGFYHIVGNILSGEDVWQPIAKNHSKQVNMLRIADGFEVGFSFSNNLVRESFPASVCQMEISFWVPWVINEPYKRI